MNRLEQLGWGLVAAERLGLTSGEGRVLQFMAVERPGRACTAEVLHTHLNPFSGIKKRPTRYTMSNRMAHIRAALRDTGLGHVEHVEGQGYRISAETACAVRAFIEGAV